MYIENYYAKSANPDGTQETIEHHLRRCGELCSQFLSRTVYGDWGLAIGNIHDFGKISPMFQLVLKGKKQYVNHALPAAALAFKLYKKKLKGRIVAAVVASHHSELRDFGWYSGTIDGMLRGDAFDKEGLSLSMTGEKEYEKAKGLWQSGFQKIRLEDKALSFDEECPLLAKMLLERILFSALIDADWSSSAEVSDDSYIATHTGAALDAEAAMERLLALRERKRQASKATSALNELRDRLFENCREAAVSPPGLFTLTAPTGLGKTLALFAFAAGHCMEHKKRRIILILPYLSIIEQNAKDYRELVPELLEMHSNATQTEETRLLAERWDAPCIVTTNVSFLEPLFSNLRGDCRHLHQFTDSVIVLDEAQSLPTHLLDATLRTLKLLCESYGCTVVLSTATQPSYKYRPGLRWSPTEIVSNPQELFDKTRRVKWHWNVGQDNKTPLSEIADRMLEHPQACTVLNRLAHTKKLFGILEDRCGKEELFYLTSDLCPAHRSKILEEIKRRLAEGLPCYLVASPCVEVGVDFSFPVLFRALAPLDSLIQAAGRCNRNGELAEGHFYIFEPDEADLYPDTSYGNAAECARELASKHEIDCNDLSHIEEYYCRLFEKSCGDKRALQEAIEEEDFEAVRREYKIISQRQVQVIVPYSEAFDKLRQRYESEGLSYEWLRDARGITVSTYKLKEAEEKCERLYFGGKPTDHYILHQKEYYHERLGLCFDAQFDGFY